MPGRIIMQAVKYNFMMEFLISFKSYMKLQKRNLLRLYKNCAYVLMTHKKVSSINSPTASFRKVVTVTAVFDIRSATFTTLTSHTALLNEMESKIGHSFNPDKIKCPYGHCLFCKSDKKGHIFCIFCT